VVAISPFIAIITVEGAIAATPFIAANWKSITAAGTAIAYGTAIIFNREQMPQDEMPTEGTQPLPPPPPPVPTSVGSATEPSAVEVGPITVTPTPVGSTRSSKLVTVITPSGRIVQTPPGFFMWLTAFPGSALSELLANSPTAQNLRDASDTSGDNSHPTHDSGSPLPPSDMLAAASLSP
jgi:hypothetical protein